MQNQQLERAIAFTSSQGSYVAAYKAATGLVPRGTDWSQWESRIEVAKKRLLSVSVGKNPAVKGRNDWTNPKLSLSARATLCFRVSDWLASDSEGDLYKYWNAMHEAMLRQPDSAWVIRNLEGFSLAEAQAEAKGVSHKDIGRFYSKKHLSKAAFAAYSNGWGRFRSGKGQFTHKEVMNYLSNPKTQNLG